MQKPALRRSSEEEQIAGTQRSERAEDRAVKGTVHTGDSAGTVGSWGEGGTFGEGGMRGEEIKRQPLLSVLYPQESNAQPLPRSRVLRAPAR